MVCPITQGDHKTVYRRKPILYLSPTLVPILLKRANWKCRQTCKSCWKCWWETASCVKVAGSCQSQNRSHQRGGCWFCLHVSQNIRIERLIALHCNETYCYALYSNKHQTTKNSCNTSQLYFQQALSNYWDGCGW